MNKILHLLLAIAVLSIFYVILAMPQFLWTVIWWGIVVLVVFFIVKDLN